MTIPSIQAIRDKYELRRVRRRMGHEIFSTSTFILNELEYYKTCFTKEELRDLNTVARKLQKIERSLERME